jgi:hypothetical protein
MPKKLIHVRIDEDYLKTIETLRQKVLKDGDLHFFKFSTCSTSDWVNYVLSAGCVKIQEDFDKLKKLRGVQ